MAKIDKIDSIDTKLGSMETSINQLCVRMTNIEKTSGSLGNTTGELKRQIASLTERLQKSEDDMIKVNDQLQDLQCRSMRDNLLFFGLAERRDRQKENCFELIDEFCYNELEIDDSVIPSMDRAHRVGKYTQGKIRPIGVKFNDFKVRELIRTSSHCLRNTRYGIQEQFPKAISDRRRALQPVINEARRKGDRVNLVKDKLYINNQLYVPTGPVLTGTPDDDDDGSGSVAEGGRD